MSIESSTSDVTLFPGPFLYRTKVKNHGNIKRVLWEWIQDDKESQFYDLSFPWDNRGANDPSSAFMDHLHDLDFIKNIVFDPIADCVDDLPFEMPGLSNIHLSDIWYTYYERGNCHHPHVHPRSTFSAIYLYHLEENNKTVFFGNGSNQPYQDFMHSTSYAKEGEIIIFPSELYHYVEPAITDRITISYNVQCEFDIVQ